MSNTESDWSEYWENDSPKGEVFVTSQGDKHPALAEYWAQTFQSLARGTNIIDLASGAGSVFACLPEDHGYELFAADISEVALTLLSERFPSTHTVACSAANVPFDDGSFDLVVSQFGIEYAGVEAFAEAARVLAEGGGFVALCHISGGHVDSGYQAQLKEARVVEESDFIDIAKRLTTAAFSGNVANLERAQQDFIAVTKHVGEGLFRPGHGIHAHLFHGFRQLYERRKQYDLTDITGWLDAMLGELDVNLDRLTRMCAAALSESDVHEIRRIFEEQGLEDVHCMPFETPGNELPVAWNLTAQKGSKEND